MPVVGSLGLCNIMLHKPSEPKTGGYHIDIGQKTIQKAKAQPAEGVRQWGMLAFFLEKGETYLTNNRKGGEIGDR